MDITQRKITFRKMQQEEALDMLPRLFSILHTNMTKIAPTNCSYEGDQKLWLDYVLPAFRAGQCQILLMYAGETLAGYFQYSIQGDTMLVDEVEIRPEYHRTMVFYRFCQFMLTKLPPQVRYMTSYVRKDNQNSLSVHEKLGMERIGENGSRTSWQYRGKIEDAAARLRR